MRRARCLALALLAQTPEGPPTAVIEPAFELAGHRIGDWNGDGKSELLVVARDGRVRTWRPQFGAASVEAGELVLDDPAHTLLDVMQCAGRSYLIAANPKGVVAHAFDGEAVAVREATTLISRGKFTLRVGAPTLAALSSDVNRDGLADIVLPGSGGCELWLAQAKEGAALPTFRRAATIQVEIARWGAHEAKYLSDGLESSFAIPALDTRDVNGDGRPDLLVSEGSRRAFHLQREDGAFPLQADVSVELDIFKDSSTDDAGFAFGAIAGGGESATYEMRDLDGDRIPDYVIAQGRKVWVFRGGAAGPQFSQPSAILKAAEDVTALVVIELDDDALPDLLLVKVQIPTLATLLRGLFGEWDVSVGAIGYRNAGAATFETAPAWKNDLTLRLPGIVGLIKNPGKVLERFEELEKRFRISARGDLDGDGQRDLMLVSEDQTRLELWMGRSGDGDVDTSAERRVREILFLDQDRVWDVDRLLLALGSFAQKQVALLTRGRAFDRSLSLRDAGGAVLATLESADFDGDGSQEMVIGYRRKGELARTVFDVVPLGATEVGGK